MVRREAIEAAIPSCSFHLFQCSFDRCMCIVYIRRKKASKAGVEKVKWDHNVKASKSLIKCFQIYISWNIQLIQNGQYGWYSNDWSIDSLIAQLASVVSFPPVSSSQLSSAYVISVLSQCYFQLYQLYFAFRSFSICFFCFLSYLLRPFPFTNVSEVNISDIASFW